MGMRVAGLVLALRVVLGLNPVGAQPGPLPRSPDAAVQPAGAWHGSRTLALAIPDNDCAVGVTDFGGLARADDPTDQVVTPVIPGVDLYQTRCSESL